MQLYKSGFIYYSSSLSQSVFDVTESIEYNKTLLPYGNMIASFEYDSTDYTAYVGLLSLDTKGISERAAVLDIDLSYNVLQETINFRSKTLPEGVENKIKFVSYNGNLDTDSAYSIISSSHQSNVVAEINLDDYYTYTTGSNNYQQGTLVNSGSFTLNISSSVLNRYGYTNLIGYVDHLYQKKDFNEKEISLQFSYQHADAGINGGQMAIDISYDNTYIASVGTQSPYLNIFKYNGSSIVKLNEPNTQPLTTISNYQQGVSISKDSNYIAMVNRTSPYINIYKRSNDNFNKLPDISTPLPNNGYSCKFSYNGTYLAIGHHNSPFLSIYSRSGDTFTKLAHTYTLPGWVVRGLDWTTDDIYLVSVGMRNNSNAINIYKRSGSSFTKLAQPNTQPTADDANYCCFSQNNKYLAVGYENSFGLRVYKRVGDTFTQLEIIDPPTVSCYGLSFSYDSKYLMFIPQGGISYIYYIDNDTDTISRINASGESTNTYYNGIQFSYSQPFLAVNGGTLQNYNEIKDNYTQTILSGSDIREYTVISQSIPEDTFKKIVEPSTTGTITFASPLSESVYNVSPSLTYSRSLGELISSVELDDNIYTGKVGFVSFDVPQYKTANTTFTASINIKFNQNAQISRSNVLPDGVEDKLYILKYNGDVLTDNSYNIITSSYQIPQSNLVNTVDLSKYYTFTTSSNSNVASSSNIGYYTTSIIVPDEYITYGETNNFLIYNDQFVKKQDFINQVSGFSFDAGVQDYEFTYETQNNMQPNSTPNAFDITPDERYYIYTFGNEDPDDYAWGQLLYKNDDGTYTDITENVQFYLGSGSISVNYISTNVKFLNSGSHFIMGSTSFGTYIFSGSGEGVNRIYTNVSSGMTYNPSNMGVYHICSYNDDEYVFCSPYSWNSNNFAMYHMDYTTNTFTKLNNPTTLPNSTIYDIDVKPNGSHFVMAQTNSPYLYIYSGSGEGVNRIYTKLNVPNTQPTETARAVKYTPDNLYMICKSQNSTVDKYLVSYYTPTNNIYYKLAAPNSIAANQTPNNLYNHSTIIGDGTKYISTGGSSPRYDAYVSTGNTTSRVYNLITTNFDGIIKPTNSFIYKNNKLYCIQGLPNSNTMAPSASTSITIYNVDNINSPVLLNSGSENMLQDMWNIEEYAMSPKSDYFVTLLKNNPHIQVLKNTDGNFTKLADPTTLPIAPLNRIRFIRDYTFVCTQGSYWYMYNINTGSDTYSATQGGGNLTSFDIQMGGFGMYKLSDNHFFVSSDGTPPMKLFKYHDDIPSMSVMPDPTGFIADRFENIVIGASSDVVVGNYVIQTSNISPYIKIQYFNTQSETFQSVDTSNITLSGNPALLPTTQYNNLDYLFIFNYGTNEMLYYSGSGINENKTFTQINNTGDFVIYQYNSGIFKINPSGEYFITQDNAGIYLNKIVSYNPLEINQLEYYIFSNRGFFNSSPSQNAMFYSDYLFGISTSRDYLLFKIQNDSLVLLDNYPIDSNENAHYFNRFSNNHIVPYYNWKNPRKVFKMYQAASITNNKTSFRLNPDIELEIDVTYPIGKLGGLSGINIANVKEYNGVPLATIEETE